LILGTTLAGERLAPFQIAGAALVLAGVVATLLGKQKAATKTPQPRFDSKPVTR
jgi:drug/metabolite transporter (DMT)-like permease